jgi:GTPase involved in cell partitioning and DNA repair
MKSEILTLDTPNKNGRIYPREVMKRELKKYRKVFIQENRALVVNKQPESSTVNLPDVIAVVKKATIKKNKVIVEVEFFSDFYRQLVKDGKLSLRTSGLGTLIKQKDGTYKIGDDYELICCFLTDDPA